MNKYRAALLAALRTVLEGARKGRYSQSSHGVCAELLTQIDGETYSEMGSVCHILSRVWHRWEHYSGELAYPVPGGSDVYYDEGIPAWQGLNLGYRIDLLVFLIAELEKDEAENLPYELDKRA